MSKAKNPAETKPRKARKKPEAAPAGQATEKPRKARKKEEDGPRGLRGKTSLNGAGAGFSPVVKTRVADATQAEIQREAEARGVNPSVVHREILDSWASRRARKASATANAEG